MLLSSIFKHNGFSAINFVLVDRFFRAPTTLKSEGEVTSLSGANKREVRQQGEVVRVQVEIKIFL